jgi:cytochrome P450
MMPPLTGLCLPGRCFVSFNSARLLEDVFVKHNDNLTKAKMDKYLVSILGNQNIVFMDTFHKDYAKTRKVLSAAFFKQKLAAITKVIKIEVIEVIRECQQKGRHEVNVIDFWGTIQSRIFSSIAVGRSNAGVLCDYER